MEVLRQNGSIHQKMMKYFKSNYCLVDIRLEETLKRITLKQVNTNTHSYPPKTYLYPPHPPMKNVLPPPFAQNIPLPIPTHSEKMSPHPKYISTHPHRGQPHSQRIFLLVRKVKKKPWNTSNMWLIFALIEGIFFTKNYGIHWRWYWKYQHVHKHNFC